MPAVPPATLPPGSLAALQARFGRSLRWWMLVTLMIGTVASIMSSTIVNVAVPDMSRVFALGQERAQWMSTGFMAAMTVSMLTTPWLLGRFGYRRTYVGACALLLIGGVGGGLGLTFGWVLAMRIAEGLAAGVIQPIPAIVILRAFDRHEQGKAMGIFGMGVVLAPALGPSIGGLLVEAFGWRSIFFVVVPFCAVAIGLSLRYLPTSAPGGVPAERSAGRFDVVGLVLITTALLALLNGLVQLHGAPPGVWPLLGIALLVVAGVTLLGFVVHQHRVAQPLLNPGLFRQRAFAMGGLVAFIYGMGLFGSTYLIPVFLQLALQMPPSQAGLALLPAGLVLAATIPIAGRLADRYPIHRLVVTGLGLLALSFALMLAVGAGTALWVIMLWITVGRIGLGCVLPSLNLGAMRSVELTLVAQGSSAISFLRQIGGAVGVNLAGIFLEWRLHAHGAASLADAPAPPQAQLPAFHESFALLAAITAAAMLAARAMKPPQPGLIIPDSGPPDTTTGRRPEQT